jgi:hypothetical protein
MFVASVVSVAVIGGGGVIAADSSSHSRLIAVALGDWEEEEDYQQ